jgi:hypothetical protein
MRIRRAALVTISLALLAGCGGDDRSAGPAETATRATERPTTRPSSLGCDVVAHCFPEAARETLERCPANELDARGRAARRRLERLLARIADVDLHNEQAYEASDAVVAALASFEEACL